MTLREWLNSTKTGTPPYAFISVCHQYGCAATKLGRGFGPCNCGGRALEKVIEQYLLDMELEKCA